MTNEVMPEPRKSKRDELVDALVLNYVSMATHHSNRAIAERIVDRVIQAGWQWHPPKLEDFDLDFNKVALSPEQEIDVVDRIISGLPVAYLKPANPEGNYEYGVQSAKLYDVASLHPQEVKIVDVVSAYPEPSTKYLENDWVRLPDFDNYEINALGTIRNRWTRRVLETATEGNGGKYVEMHDKEGFAHYVSVDNQVKIVFGE